jgi:hypothetical protein
VIVGSPSLVSIMSESLSPRLGTSGSFVRLIR